MATTSPTDDIGVALLEADKAIERWYRLLVEGVAWQFPRWQPTTKEKDCAAIDAFIVRYGIAKPQPLLILQASPSRDLYYANLKESPYHPMVAHMAVMCLREDIYDYLREEHLASFTGSRNTGNPTD